MLSLKFRFEENEELKALISAFILQFRDLKNNLFKTKEVLPFLYLLPCARGRCLKGRGIKEKSRARETVARGQRAGRDLEFLNTIRPKAKCNAWVGKITPNTSFPTYSRNLRIFPSY